MKNKNQIILFCVVTFAFTLLLNISSNILSNALAQAVPAFITLFILFISKNKKYEIINLGILNIGKIKWYFLAIILPFLAILFAYSIASAINFVHFSPLEAIAKFSQGKIVWFAILFYKYFILIFLWPLVWAIGEEIGWRGFLQPKLTALVGLRYGILLTGIIWSLWHYNFIFFGNFYSNGNVIIDTILFTFTVILMAFVIGWIRYFSQSLWPCIIFHSASNSALQMWSYQFKITSSNYIYIAGEAGIANIIFWSICLYFILKKLPSTNASLCDTKLNLPCHFHCNT